MKKQKNIFFKQKPFRQLKGLVPLGVGLLVLGAGISAVNKAGSK